MVCQEEARAGTFICSYFFKNVFSSFLDSCIIILIMVSQVLILFKAYQLDYDC